MTVTLLPDAEVLATSWLRAQAEVYALVGGRVYTRIPDEPSFPLVRVRRVAGAPVLSRPLHVDAPVLQVEAYAATKGAARTLIETCRQVLAERIEGTHTAGVVSGVTFGPMSWLPDEDFDPPKPRYIADVTLTVHP